MFPIAKLYNLEGSSLDDSPIMLTPRKVERNGSVRRFRFENAWLTEPMCEQIVKDVWKGVFTGDLQLKVKYCSERLSYWGNELTSNFSSRIKSCKAELKVLRKKRDNISVDQYKEVKKKLFLILEQKEIFWRQRSK